MNALTVIDSISDVLTIAASGIAIYIFFTQKQKLKSAFDLLLNFSLRLTLTELMQKIDKLNEYNASDTSHASTIVNILKDIEGQIKGNRFLRRELAHMLDDIQRFTDKPQKITEPRKRSLVSELRECLRHLDTSNYHENLK